MTQLAVHRAPGGAVAQTGVPLASSAALTLEEVWQMATYVAESQLFPVKNAQQAFTLMMLTQSEGLHPIQAMKRYDIIDGKPCLKSAAIQAEFQRLGGVIEIGECNALEANATFSHPTLQPRPVALRATFEQYRKAGLTTKKNWVNDPEAMLWWRLVAKGVRRIYPGIVVGIYSEHEVEDMAAAAEPGVAQARVVEEARSAVAAAQVPVWGYHGSGVDTRHYVEVVSDGLSALNQRVKDAWTAAFGDDKGRRDVLASEAHPYILNAAAQQERIAALPGDKKQQFATLKALYKDDPDWVRTQLQAYLEAEAAKAEALIKERLDKVQTLTVREAGGDDLDPDGEYPEEPGSRG